jgi:beta-glucanase (GH16 family)
MRKITLLFTTIFVLLSVKGINPRLPDNNPATKIPGYKLVWADEFNNSGAPDAANWKFEHGFVRNEEYQWYQAQNAVCSDGMLQIIAKKENVINSKFDSSSTNWKLSRQSANYTSASINTRGLHSWLYGRFEIRAKIPAVQGAWPAIWTLGDNQEWPLCGEVDQMEYYDHSILANEAWGNDHQWGAKWHSIKMPISHFIEKDADWVNKFHIWRMDWNADSIKIYLDDELLNQIALSETINPNGTNPFHQAQYILLNLAIGGQRGGNPDNTTFPIKYCIDYVRVYQKTTK